MTEIAAAIHVSGGRKPKEGSPTLFGTRPFLFLIQDRKNKARKLVLRSNIEMEFVSRVLARVSLDSCIMTRVPLPLLRELFLR